jgi:hypothetical protein
MKVRGRITHADLDIPGEMGQITVEGSGEEYPAGPFTMTLKIMGLRKRWLCST